MSFSKVVMQRVKEQIVARGLTQERFAHELGVSLPTLKRWLVGQGVSLEDLKTILDHLGMSLTEIASLAEQPSTAYFSYTAEQEDFLSDNPDALAFFDYLLRGFTPRKIGRQFGLPAHRIQKYLSLLEKAGLIDWLPRDRCSLRVAGEPCWSKDGPLVRRFRNEIKETFLKQEKSRIDLFAIHHLLPSDAERVERKTLELIDVIRQSESKAKVQNEQTVSVGVSLQIKDYRWPLEKYLSKRSAR
ncbi:MAG: hypothetical protein RL189_2248 [Pseudomonadota bacterium]|jgi:transcriptional regulator with XRE-family HTH domain